MEKVTAFKATDGTLFEPIAQAKRHEAEAILTQVFGRFDDGDGHSLSLKHIDRLVEQILDSANDIAPALASMVRKDIAP